MADLGSWYLSYLATAIQAVLGIFFFFAITTFLPKFWGAPWVISSENTITTALEMAELEENEIFFDLGAGDGRVLIQAAQSFRAEAIGIEIDPIRCAIGTRFIKNRNLQKKAKLKWGNIFKSDIPYYPTVSLCYFF